jgi:two-component system, NarL family, nitrate/nitrite response regulator NarL
MKKIKLLLADDHQIVLDGLQAFLEKENSLDVVGTARNSEEILKQLSILSADVVVIDISMPPGKDGIETGRIIKKEFPQLKIVLLTMHGDGRFIVKAMQYGFHGYVLKEKSKESLVGAIHAVMNGQTYFPPDVINLIQGIETTETALEEVILTQRELEILCLLVNNPAYTSRDIANTLFIAKSTAEKHIQNMRSKLNMKTTRELILYGLERRLC